MTKPINRKLLSPEKYAESGSEDAHQIALFMWAQQNWNWFPELKWLFAVPNGMFSSKSAAGRMRAMGMKKGVPDIWLPIKRIAYSGLIIELKKPKKDDKREGQTRIEQREWLAFLESQNYMCKICVGWEMAREEILSYLRMGNPWGS